jgi:uncharacterized protein
VSAEKQRQRIAIVGTGVSGLVVAHLLQRQHDITLYEANDYAGGHTHTVDVESDGEQYRVDTGFIVFNQRNYPNFTRLLDQLGVESQPAPMSFSVRVDDSGLEYGSRSLNSLLAQRRNVLRPSFLRMVRDIARFNREAGRLLDDDTGPVTLGEYLDGKGYSRQFIEGHILPMGAALWSAPAEEIYRFPARFFVRFFVNHRFLQVKGRTPWRVVRGGSEEYVKKLVHPFADRIRLSCPVEAIHRRPGAMEVRTAAGSQSYDAVVMAVHSDQALRMLSEATVAEKQVLGAIGYQRNEVFLHTDESVLPRRRRAWSSWNYRVGPSAGARVTYNMNMLQSIKAPSTFCVTLNDEDGIDPQKIIDRYVYHHPRFTTSAVAAQQRRDEINGADRVYFCGAYWGFGFHEDGVKSAMEVGRLFGEEL